MESKWKKNRDSFEKSDKFSRKAVLAKNNKLPKSSKKSRSFEYENDDE